MKFNFERFMSKTGGFSTYAKWDSDLLKTLDLSGCSLPTYDYGSHIFSLYIPRVPSKTGRCRSGPFVEIVCQDEGEIQIVVDKKMRPEDIASAVEKAVRFLAVMADAGYVTIMEEQKALDGLDAALHHDPR